MNWRRRRRKRESDLDREVQAHLDIESEEQREAGLAPEEAGHAARRAFGNVALAMEDARAAWRWGWLERLARDAQLALRSLRRSPSFPLLAVLVLALGIGANTAVFSVVNAVLVRPLAFRDPDRVMLVWEKIPARGADRVHLCAANFLDIERRNRSFEAMAIFFGRTFALTGDAAAEQLTGAHVSAPFFRVLGVEPRYGRVFQADDESPDAPGAAILSHALWQRRFGGDAGIVGREIVLNARPHRVIGIMPSGFQALYASHEIWVPLQLEPEDRTNRRSHYLMAVGRLKPGVTPQQAQADLDAIGANLEREYPEANRGRGLRGAPVHGELAGEVRPALMMLMAAAGLLLLAACVNLATLFLVRSLARQREIAIRAALGARRRHVIQQFLTEGVLLAVLGAAAGLLVGEAALRLLGAAIPAGLSVPGLDRLVIDRGVLLAALVVAIAAGVLAGLAPALELFRGAPADSLKGRSAGAGAAGYRARSVMLAVQIAFSLALLLGGGLLLRSYAKLVRVDPGFRADGVLAVLLSLPDSRYAAAPQQDAFFRQAQARIEAVPGAAKAGAIDYLPLTGSGVSRRMAIDGRPLPAAGEEPAVQRRVVAGDFFSALGIPLRQGRAFRDTDTRDAPWVAIINEDMARYYWPGENPIGRRLRLGLQGKVGEAPAREIVGVVGNVRNSLRADPMFVAYVPLAQEGSSILNVVVQSSSGDAQGLVAPVRDAVWAVDRNLPLARVKPLAEVAADSVWQARLTAVVVGVLAALTLALALTGVYGLVMQVISRRTPEIGIRMALGAERGAILRMTLREGLVPVAAGAAGGVGCALAAARLLSKHLFGISETDAATYAASVALVVGAALLAMAWPAWRASRIDPVAALRREDG